MKQFDEDDLKAEEEAGKSFLLDKSDRIGIAIVVVLELILIPTILFLPRAFKSSGGPYYKCEVLDVIDGKTLKVHLLEIEKGFYPGDSDMPLMGIWSDESQEPEIHYKNRIQLFRQHFVGQVLRSQTEVYVVDPNPPEPPRGINDGSTDRLRSTQPRQPIMIFQTPQRPSEVLLTDGSSFNQFLLANGYAVFDFTDRFLGKDDRARYEAAEVQARTARLGVWSSPESAEKYLTARATFERQERFKGAGLVLYLVTQAVLIVVIVLLMYGSRKTYGHESFIAVSKLLAIPGILLLVVFLRLVWVSPFPAENPNAQALYVSTWATRAVAQLRPPAGLSVPQLSGRRRFKAGRWPRRPRLLPERSGVAQVPLRRPGPPGSRNRRR